VELSGYFAVARRWWWTLLVAAWVAGLAGYYVASRIDPTYESGVRLLVGPINTDADTLRASGQLVQTYAQVVTTPPVLEAALGDLNISATDLPPGLLAANTRVTANDVTRVLTIRVQNGNAERASDLAEQIATSMIALARAGVNRPEGQLQIIQHAEPIPDPVAPQVSLIVLLATAAGIIAAIILILLIEYLSTSIRNREELARLAGVPVLGSVPAAAKARPDPKDLIDESSAAATVYRVLAARIVYGDPNETLQSMAIVDAESDTGSAVVAVNLARALSRLGRRVVLIDGGGHGGLAKLYGVEPAPGVRDVLSREVQPRAAMRMIGERLALIPAGFEGADLVDAERARAVINELLSYADIAIVATPPVHSGPAALAWTRAVHGTVFVARRDHARRQDVAAAAETLSHVGGRLIGAILAERPALLAGLFGRGRSGSAQTASVEPLPRPAPSVAAAPVVSSYRPSPSPMATPMATPMNAPMATPQAPNALRPSVVRASAPVAPTMPTPIAQEPPPVDPEPPVETPKRTTPGRSSTTRSRSTGRSTSSRTDPNANP
jgi:receptor protein-tyrosine kinase